MEIFFHAKFQLTKTTHPVDMDLSAIRIKLALIKHLTIVKVQSLSLELSTRPKQKVILENPSTIFSSKICLLNGIKPKLLKPLVFMEISRQFSWTKTTLVNMLSFATAALTRRTVSMDSLLPQMLSKVWTIKKSMASKFTVVQPKLNKSVTRRFFKSPKSTRTLKRDVTCLLRILHPKQLSKTFTHCSQSLAKSNPLKSRPRLITALMHLYASRHLIQQPKLNQKESLLITNLFKSTITSWKSNVI